MVRDLIDFKKMSSKKYDSHSYGITLSHSILWFMLIYVTIIRWFANINKQNRLLYIVWFATI